MMNDDGSDASGGGCLGGGWQVSENAFYLLVFLVYITFYLEEKRGSKTAKTPKTPLVQIGTQPNKNNNGEHPKKQKPKTGGRFRCGDVNVACGSGILMWRVVRGCECGCEFVASGRG